MKYTLSKCVSSIQGTVSFSNNISQRFGYNIWDDKIYADLYKINNYVLT